MINDISIRNFRGLAELDLHGLQRVNLIVGPNDSGKTSLLEAVLLIADPNQINQLPGLFRARQGNPAIRFYRWLVRDAVGVTRCTLSAESDAGSWSGTIVPDGAPPFGGPGSLSHELKQTHKFAEAGVAYRVASKPPLTCRAVPLHSRTPEELVKLVGNAHRKAGGEEAVQRLVATVDPRIKKVRVDPGEDGNQIVVDIGLSELVPVSQVGQGVYRLLGIICELIADKPNLVLIDELENGLHHSIHRQIWTGLAEIAETLDVQIIASTHSDEFLRAAHRAYSERPAYHFGVIQLFRVPSGVQGRVLGKEQIEAAIQADIELR